MATFTTAFGVDFSKLSHLSLLIGSPTVTNASAFGFTATKGSSSASVSGTGFTYGGGQPSAGTVGQIGIAGGFLTSFTFGELDVTWQALTATVTFGGTEAGLKLLLDGSDDITGSAFADRLHGYGGGDEILGLGGDDRLEGGDGVDRLRGGEDDDRLFGGAGYDQLYGDKGRDALFGGADSDMFVGGSGKDRLDGGAGGYDHANYYDAAGDIAVKLATSSWATVKIDGKVVDFVRNIEAISGGEGDDRLTGDKAKNAFSGGEGDDRLAGGAGNDSLSGNTGKDRIDGGSADDRLNGGPGNDVLIGGDGRDTFVFDSSVYPVANVDRIADFQPGVDKIELGKLAFSFIGYGGGALNPDYFVRGSAKEANDYIIYKKSSGSLFYDLNGNVGGSDPVLFAKFDGKPNLTAADFVVSGI